MNNMSHVKDGQGQKAKSVKRIIVASILAASFFIAFFATANAVASLSNSQDCNNNLVFSLAVNGTLQTTECVNLNLGPQTSSSSYCEIYTLTNEANTPITITATATLWPSHAATLKWQGGFTVTLGIGMSKEMILTLTDFIAAGTAQVTFSSKRALSVTISPCSATLDVGQCQWFTSTISDGAPPYSYQWCLNGAPVSGATKPTWKFTPTSSGSYNVYVSVTDSVGTQATSNTATVTVNSALSVTISPGSVTLDVDQSQLFTSTVTGGTPPYTYRWYLDDQMVSSDKKSNWTFTPTSAGSYKVYVNVTDSVGMEATSKAATVTVNPQLSVSIWPGSVDMQVGQPELFSSTVSGGTSPYSYQWYLNDTPMPAATSSALTFTPKSPGSYTIYVKVTDSVGTQATSNTAAAYVKSK
jgi:hypothetical protein